MVDSSSEEPAFVTDHQKRNIAQVKAHNDSLSAKNEIPTTNWTLPNLQAYSMETDLKSMVSCALLLSKVLYRIMTGRSWQHHKFVRSYGHNVRSNWWREAERNLIYALRRRYNILFIKCQAVKNIWRRHRRKKHFGSGITTHKIVRE